MSSADNDAGRHLVWSSLGEGKMPNEQVCPKCGGPMDEGKVQDRLLSIYFLS